MSAGTHSLSFIAREVRSITAAHSHKIFIHLVVANAWRAHCLLSFCEQLWLHLHPREASFFHKHWRAKELSYEHGCGCICTQEKRLSFVHTHKHWRAKELPNEHGRELEQSKHMTSA